MSGFEAMVEAGAKAMTVIGTQRDPGLQWSVLHEDERTKFRNRAAAALAASGLLAEVERLTAFADQAVADMRRKDALIEAAEGELAGLRAFAQGAMEPWPMGDLDGGTLQDIAIKHGLLREVVMQGPCGEDCACTEYLSADEWPAKCCRRTARLTGRPESDASIVRLLIDAPKEDGK